MRDVPAELAAALATRYRLERELGAGGMATVFLARDLKHERDVAIKVLRADVAAAVGVDRFLSEIRTTGNLKHPHILPLFDSGLADAVPFYVMPFIDGESLRARLRQVGRLPIGEVVRILHQLADALSHAHAKGVIHRDIKVDNVLVSDRHVFLADFGVARALVAPDGETVAGTMTGTGMMVGTPGYMAPEQIVAGPVDHRTDIYAFGALAYELLTGSPPFAGTPQEVVAAQLTRSPEPIARQRPDTPPPLASLVMRCLQKDPGDRWQRTDDLLAVLESVPTTGIEVSAYRRSSKSRVNYVADRPARDRVARGGLVRRPRHARGSLARDRSDHARHVGTRPRTGSGTLARRTDDRVRGGRNRSHAHLRPAAHGRPDRAADGRELR